MLAGIPDGELVTRLFPLTERAQTDASGRAQTAALSVCDAVRDAGGEAARSAVERAEADRLRAEAGSIIALVDLVRGATHFTDTAVAEAEASGQDRVGHIETEDARRFVTHSQASLDEHRAEVDAELDRLRTRLQDEATPFAEADLQGPRQALRRTMDTALVMLVPHLDLGLRMIAERGILIGAPEDTGASAAQDGLGGAAEGILEAIDPETFAELQAESNVAGADAIIDQALTGDLGGAFARWSFQDDIEKAEETVFAFAVATVAHARIEDCTRHLISQRIVVERTDSGPWNLKGPIEIEMSGLDGWLMGYLTIYLHGGDVPQVDGAITFMAPAEGYEGWEAIRRGSPTDDRGRVMIASVGHENEIETEVRLLPAGTFAGHADGLGLRLVGSIRATGDDGPGWAAEGKVILPDTVPPDWADYFHVSSGSGAAAGIVVGTWSASGP